VKLWAISDLHVRAPKNRSFVEGISPRRDDWLILGGDLGESEADLCFVLDTLGPRFAQLIWIPGNHELWTLPHEFAAGGLRGVAKYDRFVELCRDRHVLTPEDPYVTWPGEGPRIVLAPLFLLYDYSFRPAHIRQEDAVAWAMQGGTLCRDEDLLHSQPYPTRNAWCVARCEQSFARLSQISSDAKTVLINHYPLRQEHAVLPFVPRFTPWCGTTRTHDWHLRFRAHAVVFGHLHIPRTLWLDGVRFDEVSLGYPGQWNGDPSNYVRQILPRLP